MTPPLADHPRMPTAETPPRTVEIESALLEALLGADSVREGAAAVLEALTGAFADAAMALGVRERDSLVLHVLAEHGPPATWPTALEPQFAVGGDPGVDRTTGVLVAPLRAEGRVVGALLVANPQRGLTLLRDPRAAPVLDIAAAVVHALLMRLDAEVRHRLAAVESVAAVAEGMAHQIANPLTGASAVAQLLQGEIADEGQRAQVQRLRTELDRAFVVVNDLIEFQRGAQVLDGVLDLGLVLDRVLRFRGYAIREAGIQLEVTPLGAPAPVRADARLEHALLLAFRWAELHSTGAVNRSMDVRVLEREGGGLAVEVTDSGLGDVPEIAPGYFDWSFTTPDRTPGARAVPDLGLIDGLLQGCGGRLEVRGSKIEGTTLVLLVPRAAARPSGSSTRPATA